MGSSLAAVNAPITCHKFWDKSDFTARWCVPLWTVGETNRQGAC